ncbi:hypothetical protein ABZP36_024396 [Zizania latifolia]
MTLVVPLLIYVITNRRSSAAGHGRWHPPGPRPLPIAGNLLDLRGDNLHHRLASLAHAHGPVMMLRLGVITTVFVSSRDAAWEAFTKHDRRLAARTVPDTRRALAHSERSMVWLPSCDPMWKTLRGVAASHVFSPRSLSAARGARERKVQDMVSCFRRRALQEVIIGHVLYHGMFDLLSTVLFSVDVHANLRELLEDIVALLAKPNVSDFFPLLRPLDLQGFRHWTTMHMSRVFHIIDKIIDYRLAEAIAIDDDDKRMDVLNSLLLLMSTSSLTRCQVKSMLFDILAAGTETTKITVVWAMAELLRNPSVMATAREEMKTTLGGKEAITEADVARLPYLQAAMKESMRLHPVAPLLLPHQAVEDGIEIGGYAVAKGTAVIFNSWAIMRDPATWERPDEFFPERFLGKTGPELDLWGKEPKFIPLGSDRRLCPALPMIELVVPFTVASLLHAFEWRLPKGMSPEDVDVTERYTSNDILVMAVPLKAVPIVFT